MDKKHIHLHHSISELLKLSNDDRKREIRKIKDSRWIGYPLANEILNELEDLLTHPKSHRMINMVLYGNTNNGKSRLINKFMSRHKAYEVNNDAETIIPVVLIEMPSAATPTGLFSRILGEMWVPTSPSSNKEEKLNQIKRVFERYKVNMLIIDEFNNLADTSRNYQLQVINTIKSLGNQLQIPIVLVGTEDAKNIIRSDQQTRNRYKPKELKQWDLNDDFMNVLVNFEMSLPLKKPSVLTNELIAQKILAKSDGWLGEMAELLTLAAIKAIDEGTEKITAKLLDGLSWVQPIQRSA